MAALATTVLLAGCGNSPRQDEDEPSGSYRLEVEDAKFPASQSIAWSAFRAGRDGLDADILDGDRLTPAREVAEGLLAELPGDDALDGVRRILQDGGGADRHRGAERRGGMPAVLELVARETYPPPG